jgi:hypothetical protein
LTHSFKKSQELLFLTQNRGSDFQEGCVLLAFNEWKAVGANTAAKQSEIESSLRQMLKEFKPDHQRVGKIKILLGQLLQDQQP